VNGGGFIGPPPMRLSRDLLIRGIIYKLQERAYGGLSVATARKLEQAAADPLSCGAAKPTQPISLRPGTRLVQEWRGVTHMVLYDDNMLLSFAQFEREIAGERIRDKIAASKAKGMWMGGNVPLGYDVKDRKLVVNETEASTVRLIFRRSRQSRTHVRRS
jgi:hypothetical protein